MINDDAFCSSPFTPLVTSDKPDVTLENTISLTSDIIDSCNGTICDHLSDVEVKTSAAVSILQDKLSQFIRHKIDSIESTTNKATVDVDNCLCKTLELINNTIQTLSEKAKHGVYAGDNATYVSTVSNDKQTDAVVKTPSSSVEPEDGLVSVYYDCVNDEYRVTNLLLSAWPKTWKEITRGTYIDKVKAEVSAEYNNANKEISKKEHGINCTDRKSETRIEREKREDEDRLDAFRREISQIRTEAKREKKTTKIESGRPIDWTANDICDKVANWLAKDKGILSGYLAETLGFVNSKGESTAPEWLKSIRDNVPIIGGIISGLIEFIVSVPVNVADELISSAISQSGCNLAAASPDVAQYVILQLVQKWLGVDVPKIRETIQRNLDTACPTMLPNVNELDDALLSGTISEKVWECLVKANNSIPERRWPILVGKRTRQSTYELLQLYLRGKIKESDLNQKLREIGWFADNELELQKELMWQTPSPSDLIPWMLRDVFDDDVVKEFGLDDEFTQKYTDKAKTLYRAAGVNDEIARYHWMAHWVNPSNTALFEMYHRLRGGKGGSGVYRYFDKDGKKLAVPIELSKEDIKVTEEQVARAIGVNDLSPFWRDKMLAISRPPLTRTDVRRAYEIDAMSPEEVYEAFRDLGYSEENANVLLRFATKQKERGNVRKKGRILPSRIAIMYEQFVVTKDEAIALLTQAGLSREDATETINISDVKVKAATKGKCLKEIRKRYMYGDIEESQLSKSLLDIGMSQEQAVEYVKSMKCERANRHKEATASQLCEWFSRGLINRDSYKIRLLRIGFPTQDVERIISACDLSTQEKMETKRGRKQAEKPVPESKENPDSKGK